MNYQSASFAQDSSQQQSQPHELAEYPPFDQSNYDTVNVSEFLKSTSQMNKSLSTAATEKHRIDCRNSQLNHMRSKPSFDQNVQNIDPRDMVGELKRQLHETHKKQANQRLIISKLKSSVQQLTAEVKQLKSQLLQSSYKITRNNEYILKLDNQLRLVRTQSDRQRRQTQLQHEDFDRMAQENSEMRFVIQELLSQLDQLKSQQTQSDRNSMQKRQNITELMKDMRTYPSSESSRSSNRKGFAGNAFDLTMNPKANNRNDNIMSCERNDLVDIDHEESNENMHHIDTNILNDNLKMRVLSVINEDTSENSSKAATEDYIRSRINELASLNQSISCGRSFMYASDES